MREMLAACVMCLWLSPSIAVAEAQRDAREHVLLEFARDYAAAAGLKELKTATRQSHVSEIRIWTGFGLISPHHAVILKVIPGQPVKGRALNRFRYDPDDSEYMRELLSECANAPQYWQDMVTCDAKLANPVDWQALYERVELLGIASLPDESSLPPTEHRVHDGAAVVVEIATPSGYRAYEYSNPMFRSEPEAKAALEIMRAVNDVFN
jgi:hypothetical protein